MRLHGELGGCQRIIPSAIAQQHGALDEQRLEIGLVVRQDLVERRVRLVLSAGCVIERCQTDARRCGPFPGFVQRLQQRPSRRLVLARDVEVGERDGGVRRLRHLDDLLQVLLCVIRSILRDRKVRHRPQDEGIVGLEPEGLRERLLRVVQTAAEPIKIGEREIRGPGPLIELDRLLEGSFRGIPFSATDFEHSQIRICCTSVRRELDGFFDLGDRGVEVLQTGKRIRQENLRLHVSRCRGKSLVRPDFGIVESSGKQEDAASSDLDVGTIDQHIRGADELHRRLRCLSRLCVGPRQA